MIIILFVKIIFLYLLGIAWCFAHLPVLTRDLNEYVSIWNSHHIRPVRLAGCPSGRPDDMFDMPEEFGEI